MYQFGNIFGISFNDGKHNGPFQVMEIISTLFFITLALLYLV